MSNEKIAVIGASGYIGSQLVPRLLKLGYSVKAIGRNAENLRKLPWAAHKRVEIAEADVLDQQALKAACQGSQIAYYFVHSMGPMIKDFVTSDRKAAENMVAVAQKCAMKRIIYLGGLGEDDKDLSKHLRSRMEVSQILHAGSVPVTTLRAAMIIGKGSASFEILRHLVHRLPLMITPRWVSTLSQPIALENALNYLTGCLDAPQTAGEVYDIGGPDIVSYRQLMDIYAREKGLLKRFIIPVPVLTPRLSSYWIHLVTPYPSYIARPLAEGLKNKVVCRDERIRKIIPQPLLDCRGAIRCAIDEERSSLLPEYCGPEK